MLNDFVDGGSAYPVVVGADVDLCTRQTRRRAKGLRGLRLVSHDRRAREGHERHHFRNGNNLWDLGFEALGILREVLDCESLCLPVNPPKPFKSGVSAEDSESLSLKGRSFSKEALELVPRGRSSWRQIKSRVRQKSSQSSSLMSAPACSSAAVERSGSCLQASHGSIEGRKAGPFQGKQWTSIGRTPQSAVVVAGGRPVAALQGWFRR